VALTFSLLAVLSQLVSGSLIYVEFHLRKDFIIKKICEERFLEINTCAGKCFIVDRFGEKEKQESEEMLNDLRPLSFEVFWQMLSIDDEVLLCESSSDKFPIHILLYLAPDLSNLLKPPRVMI